MTVRDGHRTRWAALTEKEREREVYAYSVQLRQALGLPPIDRKEHRRRYLRRHDWRRPMPSHDTPGGRT